MLGAAEFAALEYNRVLILFASYISDGLLGQGPSYSKRRGICLNSNRLIRVKVL